MSRLRTLTSSGNFTLEEFFNDDFSPNDNNDDDYVVHFPVDGYNPSSSSPDKPPRSMSQTKSSSRKSKSSLSSSIKQKHSKSSSRHRESKWYLDTLSSSTNTNNNNNNNDNNFIISSAFSTPSIDRSSRKLEDSTTSSQCSTPNERSLARAIFDINSMLINISLGRNISLPSTPQHQPVVLRSVKKMSSTFSKRTSSSSVTDESDFVNINYKTRSAYSPARPNSLTLSSQHSSQNQTIENGDDNENYYSAQSSKLSTPMIHSIKDFDEKLLLPSKIDLDKTEQQIPQIKLFKPQMENNDNSYLP